jgi:hypothetical protein
MISGLTHSYFLLSNTGLHLSGHYMRSPSAEELNMIIKLLLISVSELSLTSHHHQLKKKWLRSVKNPLLRMAVKTVRC